MDNEQAHKFMQRALVWARQAFEKGEVPVGAVLVKDGIVLAEAENLKETNRCATAHAEIRTLQEGSGKLGAWRLEGTTLFVTLEPCLMCSGALVASRVEHIVFGAWDEKNSSLLQALSLPELNHRPSYTGGVLETECSSLLIEFFASRR